jgi:hypothetical protein
VANNGHRRGGFDKAACTVSRQQFCGAVNFRSHLAFRESTSASVSALRAWNTLTRAALLAEPLVAAEGKTPNICVIGE